jgi:arginine:ornithine antiporter / lysine permease
MASADTTTSDTSAVKLTFLTMAGMVVGSMVGAGVFSLPRRFAQETGVTGALIAWLVAGTGMLMLAFVFQTLAIRKPNLDAGVYAYAKAGFGEYIGFFSAFGYWASACVGNVTYWVLIMSTVGAIAPALGHGDTLLAIALSSVGVWVYFYFIQRGVRDAAVITVSSPSPRSFLSWSSSYSRCSPLTRESSPTTSVAASARGRCSPRSRARCWSPSSCS